MESSMGALGGNVGGRGGRGRGRGGMQWKQRLHGHQHRLLLVAVVAVVVGLELGCCGQSVSATSRGGPAYLRGDRDLQTVKNTPEQRLDKAMNDSLNGPVTLELTEDVILTKPLTQFWGRLHIKGACAGGKCAIDGAKKFSIFDSLRVSPDCHLTLENVILRNAKGGAVRGKCDIKAIDSHFISNHAGGAINVYLGHARWDVEGCLFEDNHSGNGGAIYSSSSGGGKVVNSVFRRNAATSTNGGAVYIDDRGFSADHFRVFEGVTFDSNSAKQSGGAVYMTAFYSEPRTIYFLGTTFTKNVATSGHGGAVAFESLVHARFCKDSKLADGANQAAPGKGNDLALLKSQYYPSHSVEFCPAVPPTLSLYVTPDPIVNVTVRAHCHGCTPPS